MTVHLLFSGGLIYQVSFWAAFLLWVCPEIVAAKMKRSTDPSKARDRGSLNLIASLWFAGMAGDFAFSFLLPGAAMLEWRHELFFVGIFLMLSGSAFRWYSIAVLGKYFTFDVAVHTGQVVIEAGPYRYIRHPSYAGALVSLIGLGLALGNWVGLAVAVACLGVAYAYRIPVEEEALLAGIGEPYRNYMSRTWRLIPFLF